MDQNLSEELLKNARENVREIANILHEAKMEDDSLMYGKTGIALFLFHYWRWKKQNSFYKKATELINGVFSELGKQIYLYKKNRFEPDFSFAGGMAGVGWGLNYLIKNDFLECDLQETMCLIDATIYRKMINGIRSDGSAAFKDALLTGMYAINRDDRLAKEYMRRFVNELNELMAQPDNAIIHHHINNNSELIALLKHKIVHKHPDIFTGAISVGYQDRPAYRKSENPACRKTDNPAYRKMAERCYKQLCIPKNGKQQGIIASVNYWLAESQGLWKIHYGINNGLAGFGLVLLDMITSGELTTWDETLFSCKIF